MKCDHCGKGLGLSDTKEHSNYCVCNTYKKKGPAKCTSHYLPYDDLCVRGSMRLSRKSPGHAERQNDREQFFVFVG